MGVQPSLTIWPSSLSGSAFFIGGVDSGGEGVTSVDKVGPSGSCRMPVSIPVPRTEHTAARLGRFLVVCGGMELGGGGNGHGSRKLSDRCDLLDPEGGRWFRLPPIPSPLAGASAVVVQDKMYLLGGRSPAGASDKVFIFDRVLQYIILVAQH